MDKHDRSRLGNLSLKNPWNFLALGFGSGLCPKAPGTCGSLCAIPLCILLIYMPFWASVAVIILTFILGVIASNKAEKALGFHDCSSIVIDEFAGMFISVLFFPKVWYLAFLAFVLFRVFDILKPFPISYLDKRIGGGLGIMVDDIAAGFFACISAHILFLLWPQFF